MNGKKIAVQLRAFEPWKTQLDDVRAAGFRYVAFCFEGEENGDFLAGADWERRVADVREELEKYGLVCVMTHAPCYDLRLSADVEDESKAESVLRSIKATKMLGADITAIHPRTFFHPEDRALKTPRVLKDKSLEYNVKLFSPAVEECEKHGVRLGIENIPMFPGWDVPFYSCYPEDHAALVDAFGSRAVCAVWDFGHSNLMKYDKPEAIRILGGRIKGTHVHGNNGRYDLHAPPSYGSVDWKSVMGVLKDTGYDGFLTLETKFDFELAPRSYTRHVYDCIDTIYRKYFEGGENGKTEN